jgi:peptidyl-prolyl cis-trans isomerase C
MVEREYAVTNLPPEKEGGTIVSKKIGTKLMLAVVFTFFITVGCDSQEKKAITEGKPVMAPGPGVPEAPAKPLTMAQAAPSTGESAKPSVGSGIAVEVDGEKLKMSKLDTDIQKQLETIKGKIPAESLENAKAEIRRGLIDEFVVRTLMNREITKRKVTADDKEITEILESLKAQLPTGMTIDEFQKKNKIDAAKMKEEIGLNIRMNKLIMAELGGKVKITDQEIVDFYKQNQDKFKQPESVHARHILVAKAPEDTDKIKTGKKTKVEELRKQLVNGADFADVAAKNSDCPSKQNGGDLGTFSRGQLVKPFEDAAFSQKKNAIGPVVETDFGFHIIQVLEHQIEQVAKLDAATKKQINEFLERQKQQAAFEGLVKRLKAGANILVYGK